MKPADKIQAAAAKVLRNHEGLPDDLRHRMLTGTIMELEQCEDGAKQHYPGYSDEELQQVAAVLSATLQEA